MAPKRKYTEHPEEDERGPTYVSQIQWLCCLTHMPEERVACGEVKENDDNQNLIWVACKLVYLLYHNIDEHGSLDAILQYLNKSDERDSALSAKAKTQQSSWKGQILNKYLLPHIKELERKWCIAHPYASFKSLSESDRVKLWMSNYDADPVGTITAMYKPVVGVIDLRRIFSTDLSLADDNAKMRAIREMLRRKYYFGCESTYKYRVEANNKDKCFADWAAYGKFKSNKSSIVPFENLPISPKILASMSTQKAEKSGKKAKKAAPSERDSDSLSISSPPGVAGSSTLSSTVFLLATGGHEDVGEHLHVSQSSRFSHISSTMTYLPAIEKGNDQAIELYKGSAELFARPQGAVRSPSSSIATSFREADKPASLGDSIEISTQNLPVSPTPAGSALSSEAKDLEVDDDFVL